MGPKKIRSTFVRCEQGGKKQIFAGDQVKIIPADIRVMLRLDDEEYFANKSVKGLMDFLGTDLLTISWIGRWPCGRDMLYFKSENGEPGCQAENFMAI
jgi:hypothetical protein